MQLCQSQFIVQTANNFSLGRNSPISKPMLSTDPTLVPRVIPRSPGDWHTRFATFWCVTSTPFGVPVVPVKARAREHNVNR